MRERANVLLAWPNVREALGNPEVVPAVLDPAKVDDWKKEWVLSERAPLAWSYDKARVFFGAKAQVVPPDTGRKPSTDSLADVDVWRTTDTRIQSAQMIRAPQEQNFTYRQAFDVNARKYVHLADTTMRELDVSLDGRWAVGRDVRSYVSDWKPPQADIYRVNTATGERTLIIKGQITAAGGVVGLLTRRPSVPLLEGQQVRRRTISTPAPRTCSAAPRRRASSTPTTTTRARGRTSRSPASRRTARACSSRTSTTCGSFRWTARARRRTSRSARARSRRCATGTSAPEPIDERDPLAARHQREIDLTKPMLFETFGEYTKDAGFARLENGKLTRAGARRRRVRRAVARGEGGQVPLHAADVRRVPGPARLGRELRGLEEDHQREPAAGRLQVGREARAVRLQGQGRAHAAGLHVAPRGLAAGEEAPDAGEFLREELAEPEPVHGTVVHHGDGRAAGGGGEPRVHHDVRGRVLPHGLVAQRPAERRRGGDEEGRSNSATPTRRTSA